MSMILRKSIRQILIAGSATAFAAGVVSSAFASAGVQIPPPGPNQVPDYFGVVANFATSPAPIMAIVSGGLGKGAAATTYDYQNINYGTDPHGLNTSTILDVQGGSGYAVNDTLTVTGNGLTGPVSCNVTVNNVYNVANGSMPQGAIIPNVDPTTGAYLSPGVTGLATCVGFTTPIAGSGIRKFIDSVSLPNTPNDLGQQMPVAVADTTTFPGSDFYDIAEIEYTQQMHKDLPPSHLRGYVQVFPDATATATQFSMAKFNAATNKVAFASQFAGYLGPIIISQKDRAVRIRMTNLLSKTIDATGLKGALPFPVDHTYMGANDTDNRTSIHLHGGNTPWISDGTPREWMKPKLEGTGQGKSDASYTTGNYNKGISASNVPDMWFDATGALIASCAGSLTCATAGATNNPGDGAETFYYTNQQSQRLQFYHDHAEGITRLNVYDGMAAGYLIKDPTENAMINGTTAQAGATAMGYSTADAAKYDATHTYASVLPPDTDMIPLVIHEKTFVPDNTKPVLNFYGGFASQLNAQDPTWRWGTNGTTFDGVTKTNVAYGQYPAVGAIGLNGTGDLWLPHVWMTNQNPGDISGANAVGRWDYGSWFWPPFTGTQYTQVLNPYFDPACNTTTGANVNPLLGTCEGKYIPGIPNGASTAANSAAYTGALATTLNPGGLPLPSQLSLMNQGSGSPESFNDTPLVNGTVYPFINVDPKKYRLRILSVGNDRTLNLSLFVASPNTSDTTSGGNVGTPLAPVCDGSTAALTDTGKAAGIAPLCTEVRMVPWNATQNATSLFPAWWYTSLKGGITFDGRPGGVPDPSVRGPAMVQIGTEGGFLSSPAVIKNQPINFEYNVKNIQVTNVKEHALLLGPAERADVVVDFSQFAGSTLILYNDSPAAIPAYDLRLDYFTGDFDNTDTGGTFSTLPGYGPNSRTLMQFRVATSCTTLSCGSSINPAAAVAPNAGPTNTASRDYVDAKWLNTLTSEVNTAFKNSQEPIIVPQAAYNAVYGTSVADSIGVNQARISDTLLTAFKPIQDATTTPATLEATPVTLPLQPKTIQELFTQDFGRMNATLGTEVPNTTGINQTTIPLGYIDPPTELVQITQQDSNGVQAEAIGQLNDGTQLWKITHNGVDTHAIHFHLFHVQVVNRVGWDGAMYPPEPNELGWKDVVRMNPLADVIVALRPKTMTLPFKVGNSHRPMDAAVSAGAVDPNLSNLDPTTGGGSNITTNDVVNYGWEYVWHCHILGHEENDMMRTIAVARPPEAPVIVSLNGNQLNWTDNSLVANWATVQRTTTDPTTALAFSATDPGLVEFNMTTPECNLQAGCSRSYIDTSAVNGATYAYRVISKNTVGSGDVNAKLPVQVASLTNNFTGHDNVTASSASAYVKSTPAAGPIAQLSVVSLDFGNQTLNNNSLAQSVTLSNIGTTPLTITSTILGGTNANQFSRTTTCGASLNAGASCAINVVFRPTTAGAKTATLTVTDNSSGSTTQVVNLTGIGVAAAYGTITPASLTFANTNVGTTTASQTLTLRNTGSAALVWTTITPPAGFTVTGGSCTTLATKLLNANGTCQITVAFAPLAGQAYSGNLAIVDNTNVPPTVVNGVTVPGNPTTTQNVALTGTGVAIAAVSPAPVVSNLSQTGLTLTWAPVAGATNYRIQRATNAGFTTGLVTSANQAGTTFTVTGLTGNTTYFFRVVAVNSLGTATNGLATGAVLTIPGTPTAVAAVNGTAGGAITGGLRWTAPAGGATSYLVSWTGPATGSATTTSNTQLTFATAGTYSMRVTAVNASGSSVQSAAVNVTVR